MKLNKKNILITGASSGIGKAFALKAAKDKCNIILASRNKTKLQNVAKEVNALGSKAHVILTDVTKPEEVKELFLETKKQLGSIDLVFNNAGLGHIANIHELTVAQIEQIIDVNIKGMILVTKFSSEVMTRQNYGHIIMTASLASFIALPKWSVYNASKWAILGFAECIRPELKPFNIKVTTIHPGLVKSEFFAEDKANLDVKTVGSGYVTPEEVANKVYKASLTTKETVILPISSKVYAKLYKFAKPIANFLVNRLASKAKYKESLPEDSPEFED